MENEVCGSPSVFAEMSVFDVARKVKDQQDGDAAFFVCDLSDLDAKMKLWRQELPNVTPFYAVKACADPVVLHALNSYGIGFDCTNKPEMMTVLDVGVTPDRVLCACTIKCPSHLKFASEHGVNIVTFDSAEELVKMKDQNARFLLRIEGSTTGSKVTMNEKFGARLDEVEGILQVALKMGLNVDGVAFHVGASYSDPVIYAHSIEDAKKAFDIGTRLGLRMTTLDIGGSFPGGSRKRELFLQVCGHVRRALATHFPPSSGVQVLAEPGQYFVTSAYSLIVKVIGKKKRNITVDGVASQHQDVYINESIDNAISGNHFPILGVKIHPLNPPYDRPHDLLTTVWGGSRNSTDYVMERGQLFDVDADEWLLMDNMGCYGISSAQGFNGLGFPPVTYIAPVAMVPSVQRIVDSMVMRGGYGQVEQAIKLHFPRMSLDADRGTCAQPTTLPLRKMRQSISTGMSTGREERSSVFVETDILAIARRVIKEQERNEAFFICDLNDLESKVNLWRRELPRVTPFFAVKACADPVVVHTLNSMGINFDCSNKNELEAVLDIGVSPERILYASPVKCSSHLKFASERGVTLMAFDSVEELAKIKDENARLLLRVDVVDNTNEVSTLTKFGTSAHEVEGVLNLAFKMGRRVVGILFHVKSARHDPDTFTLAVKHAKTAFDIGTRLGFRMTVLSIGGGFLGGTRMQDSFLKVCEAIRSAIDIHFPPSEGLEIIAEPGQFLVTSAYSLVVKVLHKRKRSAKIGGVISDPTEIFINESNTNTISRYTLPRVGAKIHPVNPPFDRPLDVLTTVWGSSCHPGDCVIAGELLFDMSIGEWLLIDNMGAYAVARASGFNGHGFPPVNYVSTAAKLSSVQGILDSTVMRGGYGQVEQAIKARQQRRTEANEKM